MALRMAKTLISGLTNIDARAVADEVSARIGEELDYSTELVNQADFAALYSAHPFIRIPRLFPELSGPHVLTMELVRARRWEDALEAGQDLRDRWGEAIDRFFYNSIHRFGLFNADPHPGNYLFHDDGAVTFLDFGCVKRFTPEQQRAFYEIADAVLADDAEELRRLFVTLGFLSETDAPSAHEIMEFYRPTFESMLAPQPYTFTPEFAAKTVQHLFDPYGPAAGVNRKFDIPQDFVFVNRIYIGMNSVLGALRATADWRAMYDEARTGVPATEFGALDMAWYAKMKA
jgi:predicted unusual protein kinase regulating ubiquinone biosynthesis (AarF/ABC1/UbiB family)